MLKSRSAPNLQALGGGSCSSATPSAPNTPRATALVQPSFSRRSESCTSLARIARSVSPSPAFARGRGSVVASAFFPAASQLPPPPPPAEAAVVEAAGVARGILATECFEKHALEAAARHTAPPLVEELTAEKKTSTSSSLQLLTRKLSTRSSSSAAAAASLASCLVTPVTEEEDPGETAREQLRRSAAEAEAEVESRFTREVNARTTSSVSAPSTRFAADPAPTPASSSTSTMPRTARGVGSGGGPGRRRGGRGNGGGGFSSEPLDVVLIALGAPAPPEVVSTLNRSYSSAAAFVSDEVEANEEAKKKKGDRKEEGDAASVLVQHTISASSAASLATIDEGEKSEDKDDEQKPAQLRVDTLPPALDKESPETMRSLASLTAATLQQTAAANTLSIDEEEFFPLPLVCSKPSAVLCSLDVDDERGVGIDDAESDDERDEVIRFLEERQRSNVVPVSAAFSSAVAKASAKAKKSKGVVSATVSSAMLVAAASGAAPSPWVEEGEEGEEVAV